MPTDHQVTRLIDALRHGDGSAFDRMLPLVYDELRRIAHRQLARGKAGATLNTTALVHESYLKLAGGARLEWSDRAHFFAVAARAMRHILIDRARSHRTSKRGAGRWRRIPLDQAGASVARQADSLLALDEALGRLAAVSPRQHRVVECRFFGGMTEEETAVALGVTPRTVRRDWLKARMWLYAELSDDEGGLEDSAETDRPGGTRESVGIGGRGTSGAAAEAHTTGETSGPPDDSDAPDSR